MEARQAVRGVTAAKRAEGYWADPVAWAHDCLVWPEGKFLADYQQEILMALVERRRAAVRGPHGLGKTAIASIAVDWFATTREAAGVDWKVLTTASVGRQLTQFFWPEIRKWARLMRWDVIGMDPWRRGKEMLEQHIKLTYGEASALTSDDPSGIEGAHATELLYVFDEAKAIDDGIFDAAEGAFSTAGKGEVGTNAYALAISTPGEPIGRFYDIHARKPGTEAWWVRHVTVEEAEAAGRVTREWVDQQYLLWGDSAIFANRVLGEFMSSSEDTVIPLAWVELANDRWRARFERVDPSTGRRAAGRARDARDGTPIVVEDGMKLHTLGVDVARGGEDRSVIALRQGNTIMELRRYAYSDDTMLLANQIDAIQGAHQAPVAIVDVIGVGAGVYDRQRERGRPCRPFNSSEATKRTDISGEFGFANKRSHAWWNLREMLDPQSGCDVALPPDDRLTGDLVAPKWRLMAGGRIQVESKDEIKKRIHRSTDDGDSVVYCMIESGGSWADLYKPQAELDPDDATPVPQPRQPLRRGWGDVYKTDAQIAAAEDENPTPVPPPGMGQMPSRQGGWFGPSR